MVKCSKTSNKPEGYRFLESGLDYVYLLNGYELDKDEEGEEILSIKNADQLHKEIAKNIVLHKENLSYQEVRFLRVLLRLTQEQLAKKIGVSSRQVQNWESHDEKSKITESCESLLRIMIWEIYLDNEKAIKFFEENKKNRTHYKMMRLKNSKNNWEIAKAA
jgi:DNA-binding transcriptional regulator YiaG